MEMEKGPDRRNTADMSGVSSGFGAERQIPPRQEMGAAVSPEAHAERELPPQQGDAVPNPPNAGPLPVDPPVGPQQTAYHGMPTAGVGAEHELHEKTLAGNGPQVPPAGGTTHHQHPSQQGGAVPGQPGAGPLPVEPPAGPSQPAHPGSRTAGPIQVVACRRLSAAQYRDACRASGGGLRIAALVLLLLLNALLAFRLVGGLRIYPRGWQTSVFAGLMLLALAGGIAAALWLFLRPGRLLEKACACYLDSEPPEGVIELYNDRVVQKTAASVEVVEFCRVNRMVETADLILIGQPGRIIAWRAEDLAPYDAHFLLDALQRRIPPGRHRRRAPFHPWLQQPLPLPVIRGGAPAWLTVSVPEGGQTVGGMLRGLAPIYLAMLPFMLLFAGEQAIYAHLTPSLLLDTGIYALIFYLVYAVLLLIVQSIRTVRLVGRAPREYAFTPDGLAVKTGDSVGFIHKRDIEVKNGKRAVRLQTPVGCFTIPWSAVGDPDRLRQILSL